MPAAAEAQFTPRKIKLLLDDRLKYGGGDFKPKYLAVTIIDHQNAKYSGNLNQIINTSSHFIDALLLYLGLILPFGTLDIFYRVTVNYFLKKKTEEKN